MVGLQTKDFAKFGSKMVVEPTRDQCASLQTRDYITVVVTVCVSCWCIGVS